MDTAFPDVDAGALCSWSKVAYFLSNGPPHSNTSAGVIAGGAVREVLELSGVKNGFGKQLGSDNPLNNARATIDGLAKMRTLKMAARNRDITVEQMLGAQ